MPIFEYTAVKTNGNKQKGYVDADSVEMAGEKLAAQKLLVTMLEIHKSKGKKHQLSPSLVLNLTRDLAQLLKAGLPLYDSLIAIEEKYQGHKAHFIFLDLCDQVKHGTQLSQALKRYPKSFDSIYIAMVAAGERSAGLAGVFDELASLISRSQKLKKQVTSAMIYPAFIGSFCLIVISVLLFFLVPSMAELFEDRPLHPMTAAVLGLSHWLQEYGVYLLVGILTCLLGILVIWKKPAVYRTRAKLLLHLPIIAELTTQAVMIRFCKTLSRLLDSGVPLLEGLQLARSVMHHPMFEEAILSCESKVMEGKGLAEHLKEQAIIPKSAVRMLAIAEDAGTTAEMLGSIADLNSEELEKNLTRLTAYLQPVVLLVLGVIVGVILLSVLLPLTDVSSFLE